MWLLQMNRSICAGMHTGLRASLSAGSTVTGEGETSGPPQEEEDEGGDVLQPEEALAEGDEQQAYAGARVPQPAV